MKYIRLFLNIISSIIMVVYPFIIYYSLQHNLPMISVITLLLILTLRTFTGGRQKFKANVCMFAVGICLCALFIIKQDFIYMKLYPIAVNMFCLFIFGSTLMWGEKSLVERIAAIITPIDIVNGSLATITAFWCSDKIWAFYTGFLSYLLIALMFIAEYFYRNRLKSQRSI